MRFRAATLNLEQDHKRWDARRELVLEQLGTTRPDVMALNEVCIPLQTARWLQKTAKERFDIDYYLVQQTRVNGLAEIEGEALLTRFPVVETGNLDFRARDMVALVARLRSLVRGLPGLGVAQQRLGERDGPVRRVLARDRAHTRWPGGTE